MDIFALKWFYHRIGERVSEISTGRGSGENDTYCSPLVSALSTFFIKKPLYDLIIFTTSWGEAISSRMTRKVDNQRSRRERARAIKEEKRRKGRMRVDRSRATVLLTSLVPDSPT